MFASPLTDTSRGSNRPSSRANSTGCVFPSFTRNVTPPSLSKAAITASRTVFVVLFNVPFGRPLPAFGGGCFTVNRPSLLNGNGYASRGAGCSRAACFACRLRAMEARFVSACFCKYSAYRTGSALSAWYSLRFFSDSLRWNSA